MIDRRSNGHPLCVLALLAGSLVLNLIPFWWGAAPIDTWAFDEITPVHVLGHDMWPHKYPPLYRTLSAALLIPLESLELGPRLGWDRETTLRNYLLIMRLLNVAFGTATVWLVYRIGRLVDGWRTGWLAGAALALSAPFTYYAKMANLDAPQLFFFAASVLAALRWLDRRTFGSIVAMTVFAAAAIATKTSIWAHYVLWPIVLLAASPETSGTPAVSGRPHPIRDWRPWTALLVGLAALGIFLHVPPVITVREHMEGMARAVRSTPPEWPKTVAGHLGLLADGFVRWAYVLGLPLSLAAIAGLALLFFRRQRLAVALLITVTAIAHYGLSIAVVRFQADRYYLPVALLAAVAAGYALDRLLALRRHRTIAALVVAVCFSWAGARALAVGALMLSDTRLAVERWVADRSDAGSALAIGRAQYLPGAMARWPLQRVERKRCKRLAAAAPAFVLVSPEDYKDRSDYNLLHLLLDGHSGMTRVRTFERPRWADWFIPRPKVTNLDKISPPIVALASAEEPCHERQWAMREAASLLADPQPARAQRLTSFLIDYWVDGHRRLAPDRVVATGIDGDGWSYGSAAVAVAFANQSSSARQPRVEVMGHEASAAHPQPVNAAVDGEPRHLELRARNWQRLRIPRLAPGERTLLLLQTDRYGAPSPGSRKRRGVRVRVLP